MQVCCKTCICSASADVYKFYFLYYKDKTKNCRNDSYWHFLRESGDMKVIETGECLTIPVYQQGQGTFYCFQIFRRGRGYIICQTARIPICAKVACYFEIKAGGLLEYKLSPVKITGPQTHLCHCPF